MVHGSEATGFFVALDQGKFGDPQRRPAVGGYQIEALGQLQPQGAEYPGDHRRLVGHEEQQVAGFRCEGFD